MLQTSRLFLRNLCSTDISRMYDYRNDSKCNLYQRYEDTGMAYLQKFVCDYSGSNFLSREPEQHYAIAGKATCEMVGDMSVFFTEEDNCFTLGITIAPQYQRQGFAYELLQEVVTQLQAHYPTVDIVALVDKNNIASIALFQKLEFIEECYASSIHSYVFVKYGKVTSPP